MRVGLRLLTFSSFYIFHHFDLLFAKSIPFCSLYANLIILNSQWIPIRIHHFYFPPYFESGLLDFFFISFFVSSFVTVCRPELSYIKTRFGYLNGLGLRTTASHVFAKKNEQFFPAIINLSLKESFEMVECSQPRSKIFYIFPNFFFFFFRNHFHQRF